MGKIGITCRESILLSLFKYFLFDLRGSITKLLLSLLIFMLILSCGKEVDKKSRLAPSESRTSISIDPKDNDAVTSFIQRQVVECSSKDCPESVGKLVVIERNSVSYCTGTLITKNILMTSSSCLTRALRVPGVNCRNKIFTIFPQTRFAKKEVYRCRSVVQSNNNFNLDPALVKSDFAFILLERSSERKRSRARSFGFVDKKSYESWRIDSLDDFNSILRKDKCLAVYKTFANPLSIKRDSPGMILSGCSFVRGNRGAAFFGKKGFVRGVLSSPISEQFLSTLRDSGRLLGGVNSIEYVSNLSCVRRPGRSRLLSPECRKKLRESELNSQRKKIFNNNDEKHKKSIKELKRKLANASEFFKWDFEFKLSLDSKKIESFILGAQCFYGVESWIGQFRNGRKIIKRTTEKLLMKNYSLSIKLNENLEAISFIKEDEKEYRVSFSPSGIYLRGKTRVSTSSILFGEIEESSRDNVLSCD